MSMRPDPRRLGRPDSDATGSLPAARYREAVYVLLPPSETKHPGGTGPPLDLASLKFPELSVIRRQLIDELVSLSSNVEASVAALHISSGRPGRTTAGGPVISPLLRDQVISNGLLSFAPTMPALLRYTGVLYAAMNDPALSRPELARADERVLITSALFGILGGGDLIPPYRMSAAAHLSGLPSMAVLWRSQLATALTGITGPVLDLRSGAYAAFAPMPGAISVRVLTMTRGGQVKPVSHDNKAIKGRLARLVATTRAEIHDAADVVKLGYRGGMSIKRTGPAALDLLAPSVR